MSRKKKIMMGTLLSGIALLTALIALIMLAAPAIVPKKSELSNGNHSMAELTFGGDKGTISFAFSFLNLLPFILVLLGMVITFLTMFNRINRDIGLVAALLFLAAGVLFFFSMQFAAFNTDNATAEKVMRDLMDRTYQLGGGAIAAGILSIVSAIATAVAPFLLSGRKKRK